MALEISNNVYGIINLTEGLQPVLKALEAFAAKGEAYIYHDKTLHLQTDIAEFESDSLKETGEFLFNGAVEGETDQVVKFVERISQALCRAAILHKFEIYDSEGKLVRTIPFVPVDRK